MTVYFLPHCAAMWRSLAPLYREHLQAGDDVSVMPIPYYGRDSAGQMEYGHYDDSFPVPVKDYRRVDLSAVHPDRIYIHNPYDADNRITSIDPAYYSDRLKTMCGELYYAPYYTVGFGGDIESAIIAPGVQNADKVVVWSEQQKQNYQRFISPDKLIVKEYPALSDRADIPDDWQQVIKGRRVVLFNNSLGALMAGPKQELQKVENIIRQFVRDPSVCPLWRPHPLYVDAINALFPQYGGLYMRSLRLFADLDGIFDLSWDLDRAVLTADEYLGSPSSVAQVFRDLGKPVRIV